MVWLIAQLPACQTLGQEFDRDYQKSINKQINRNINEKIFLKCCKRTITYTSVVQEMTLRNIDSTTILLTLLLVSSPEFLRMVNFFLQKFYQMLIAIPSCLYQFHLFKYTFFQ